MSADPILDRLKVLHPKAIDLSLDRVRRLMADLGDPQERLPPAIVVAGTNGKGSTVAILRAILEAAGRRVHAYTSPHLVRFNERIRLAGAPIDEPALAAILEEVEAINADRPITFFEVTTAAAFLAFARAPADAVLLEVGMGGRLDATNIVPHPAATAIAPVSLDHTQYLGDTLAKIAGEKAGILKPGVIAAIGPQPPEAAEAIAARATDIGATLFRHGVEWSVTPVAVGFRYDGKRRLDLPPPALAGRHQFDNAGLALAVLDHLPDSAIGEDAIRAGLSRIDWPARLQRLSHGPIVTALPSGWTAFLDGGHNDAAAEVLARWADDMRDDGPLDVVIGMLTTKDAHSFLRRLAPYVRRVRAVTIPDEPLAQPADAIVAAARNAGIAAASAPSVAAAVVSLAADGAGPARVLICGSLYLAGAVLRENG